MDKFFLLFVKKVKIPLFSLDVDRAVPFSSAIAITKKENAVAITLRVPEKNPITSCITKCMGLKKFLMSTRPRQEGGKNNIDTLVINVEILT